MIWSGMVSHLPWRNRRSLRRDDIGLYGILIEGPVGQNTTVAHGGILLDIPDWIQEKDQWKKGLGCDFCKDGGARREQGLY